MSVRIIQRKGFNPKKTFSWVLAENKFNRERVFSVLNGGLHLQPEASSLKHMVLSRGFVVSNGDTMLLKFNSIEHNDPDFMLVDQSPDLVEAFSKVLDKSVVLPQKWRQRLEEYKRV